METLKSAFDFSDFPRIDLIVAGLVLVFLLIFSLIPLSSFAMATMIQFFMFSLYGMGWNTIGGYGGQVDLGKAQYVGIGAFTTAVMLIRWDIPFWVSMPIGVCLAVIWSFIIGYPLFRLKGHYFAIATIATSLVLKDLFEVWNFVGAARGLEISPIKYDSPDFLRLIFKADIYYYYVILGIFFSRDSIRQLVPEIVFGIPAPFQSKIMKRSPSLWASTLAGQKLKPMPLPRLLSVLWDLFMPATSKILNLLIP